MFIFTSNQGNANETNNIDTLFWVHQLDNFFVKTIPSCKQVAAQPVGSYLARYNKHLQIFTPFDSGNSIILRTFLLKK